MYTEMRNTKKLKELYQRALTIKSAIPHPRIMGIIRECGGKMHMHERLWSEAATDFFEVTSAGVLVHTSYSGASNAEIDWGTQLKLSGFEYRYLFGCKFSPQYMHMRQWTHACRVRLPWTSACKAVPADCKQDSTVVLLCTQGEVSLLPERGC